VITGSTSGIGLGVARALGGEGAALMLNGFGTAQEIADLQSALRKELSVPVAYHGADMSKPDEVAALIAATVAELGRVDILVNNAGNLIYKPLVPLPGSTMAGRWTSPGPVSDEEWFGTLNTHVSASFFALRELVPGMLENRWGRVLNITSAARSRVVPFCAPYEMAKGALAALTRSLAHEWAGYQVTVNSIAPGQFHTTMSADLHEIPKSREWMMKRIPMHRDGAFSELGALALYLVSDAAAFVTGQEIFIDGGESL
jgi:NAD(P)-dependent dehydrogenase (short-subunit alcohol dehydrogenase family)